MTCEEGVPRVEGFSASNISRMRAFFRAYVPASGKFGTGCAEIWRRGVATGCAEKARRCPATTGGRHTVGA